MVNSYIFVKLTRNIQINRLVRFKRMYFSHVFVCLLMSIMNIVFHKTNNILKNNLDIIICIDY